MMVMMTMMMKTQNGHNSANFEATSSIVCFVIDLNKTQTMMTLIMMKTQNVHNQANFEATTSRFCMVTDLNDTFKIMMTMMMMMIMMMGMMITMMVITMMIWSPSAKSTHASTIYEPGDWQKMGLASYCQCFAPPLLPTKISINVLKWPTTILEGIR